MRQRILALTTSTVMPRLASMNTMEYVAALAAALLLCANLSLSVSNQTDFGLHQSPDTKHLGTAVLEVARSLPDAPSQEAFLFGSAYQRGSNSTFAQAAPMLRIPGRLNSQQDQARDF